MNLEKAAELAHSLMMKHGLGHLPFEFTRTKRVIGSCHFQGLKGDRRTYRPTKISMSAHWAKAMDEHEVREIILHEIAHGLTVTKDPGHGYVFKAQVRALGGKATDTCYKPEVQIDAPWIGVCPNGHESRMHRAPGRLKSCVTCCPRFNTNYLFVWHKNGKKVDHFDVSKGMRDDVIRLTAQGRY